ncbi:Gfo/Idh/MocA family oxidoreductase [Agriterribacter sp.]|uniref:Gfo/Idh/MocA family protein n=1 Tax=Agriterribacter sp. TaxID=2821509 RepID=UPI002C98C39D|nr:Gfo/Idh/MocA family oxidoreductase [Agriterribacter sp.]HRP57320.1 Gfo/Idh/MocA family oxidoreductase [Agriterribacter sp.]
MNSLEHIRFDIPAIGQTCPVVIIGAGGIVETAHLPAYRLAGIPVKGIVDMDKRKAERLALVFNIPQVYNRAEEMVREAACDCIYDIAVPGKNITAVLAMLPDNCYALIQKPMGENIEQAEEILALCRKKNITAGMNFQLRYAPYVLMAKQMIGEGLLGDICDLEIYVNVYTPWHLWNFLYGAPRVEILYHSIHYIDLVRNMLGNPVNIFAKTTRHPQMQQLQDVKSNIIMDYGAFISANISTNHTHNFGTHNQDAYIKIEGTKGAVKIKPGLLMNYPEGIEDGFEYILSGEPQWKTLPVNGSWFPHAFIGSMHEIIKARQGIVSYPDNSVEDCIDTMRLVEKAYEVPKA